jgi:Uncharacterized protein conserved in bacteria
MTAPAPAPGYGSLLRTALAARCPGCRKAPLYDGVLEVTKRCPACGLNLGAHDAGDGPAMFVVLILGFIVVGLALWLELAFAPPLWVHAVLWPPVILGLAIVMLRVVKSILIALDYRHHAETYDRAAG